MGDMHEVIFFIKWVSQSHEMLAKCWQPICFLSVKVTRHTGLVIEKFQQLILTAYYFVIHFTQFSPNTMCDTVDKNEQRHSTQPIIKTPLHIGNSHMKQALDVQTQSRHMGVQGPLGAEP
eukprot:656086-Pelagomonas_calceolata.AAC.5